MRKRDSSDSESERASENSSSEETGTPSDGQLRDGVPEYEKQRLSRIAENRARMEAMGLRKMASSLVASSPNLRKNKGKEKVVKEDEDYKPEVEVPSEEEDDDDEEDEGDCLGGKSSGFRKTKAKKKAPKSKNKAPVRKNLSSSDYIDDDDEALKMAIALSLQGSGEKSDMGNAYQSERKGKTKPAQEDSGGKKRKKSFASRFQMTEDELLLHFYQFDENWNGGISVRDLERMANAHDFMWTDQELADMIRCFDGDGDGMLSLEDFRKIAVRCNVIQDSEGS
ncbi:hypothetical protein UlMin_021501 [Ulmus minor]